MGIRIGKSVSIGRPGKIGRIGFRGRRIRRTKVNKYLLYKNAKRLQNLRKTNRLINLLLTLAWLPLIFAIAVVIIYPVLFFVLYFFLLIVTLGLFLLDNKFKFNEGLFDTGMLIGIIAFIVVIALIVIKRLVHMRYQNAEINDLRKEPIPEENQKYIDIYDALKRTAKAWLPNFIIILVGVAAIIGLNYLDVGKSTEDVRIWTIGIVAVIFLISLIVYRIRAHRIYMSVESQIHAIREERMQNKQKSA